MPWRLVLAAVLIIALPRGASGNGRSPATSSISFRQGHETDVAAGVTFGLLISHDGGQSWAWMCEDAIGYGGTYDPRYAFTDTGALFATTYNGLRVDRDRCDFAAASASTAFASTNAVSPDHALYYAASQVADPARSIPADFRIYRSIDDGATFAPTPGQPDGAVNWWQTIAVAPSNAQVLYLSGYAYVPGAPGTGTVKVQRVLRSDDGGASWTPLPLADNVRVAPNSVTEIVGIASDDPAHVYLRVTYDDNNLSDAIYRSTDSGATWQQIRRMNTSIPAFAVRSAGHGEGAARHHDLVLGTLTLGAFISHDDGETWTALADAPHITCLAENSAGELWACTQNYDYAPVVGDGAGIMKTTDPEQGAWTPVLHYQDLTEAVTCAAGTVQHDTCSAMWCTVCDQLGCTPSPSYACPVAVEAPIAVDPGVPTRPSSGCCEAGAGPAGALALGALVGMVLRRPRRRSNRIAIRQR